MHRHAFYPRRDRQRCTLRHVMPLNYGVSLLPAYTRYSSRFRANTVNYSREPGNRTQDPLLRSRTYNS
ncbi:hypothetical protein SFRURICE_004115 [Spodoptera frugiperda]|nr:hypothetical protein SFRURICE_004115 [Spodoptera frugiperda]